MTLPQHLSSSQEHFTPAHVVNAARKVLGRINLDPASCEEANHVVRARRWIGLPNDGLAERWGGTVFINPPGGTFTPRRKSKDDPKVEISPRDKAHKLAFGTDSRAVAWWRKLVKSYEYGNVSAAVFVGFNLDILQASQGRGQKDPLDYAICVPRERLHFNGDQPTHGNVIVYMGSERRLFRQVFSEIGSVKL